MTASGEIGRANGQTLVRPKQNPLLRVLDHLEEYSRTNGINMLRLETGIHQHDAITLYERAGFRSNSAIGEYKPDPLSRFYEKHILTT